MPRFLRKGIAIQGAIILDTIMNVDMEEKSQDVPADWFRIAPQGPILQNSIPAEKFLYKFLYTNLGHISAPKTTTKIDLSNVDNNAGF
jgi:hypothetical protein